MTDFAKLRELALSTSADEWTSDVWYETDGPGWRATGPHHEDTDEDSSPGCPAEQMAQDDAAFIAAASPSTVIELLDRIAALEAAQTQPPFYREVERMAGVVVRRFYFDGCSDRWGARVWAAVTDGPVHATNERTKWSVYHRPDHNEQWPAKLTHVGSLDETLRVGRALVEALNAITKGTSDAD